MEATLEKHMGKIDTTLEVIQDSKRALEAKIVGVTIEVNLLRADHKILADPVAYYGSCDPG